MNQLDELKPCPFNCEGKPEVQFTSRAMNCWQAVCPNCGASGPTAGDREDASKYWNERDDELVQLRAELARAIQAEIDRNKVALEALEKIGSHPTKHGDLPTLGQGLALAYERIASTAIAQLNPPTK